MNAHGLRFVLRLLFQRLPYALLTYGSLTLVESYTSYKSGVLAKASLSVVGSVLQIFFEKAILALAARKDRRRFGAREAPLLPYEKIGEIDILQKLLHEVEHGYLATQLTSYFEGIGQTFRMRLLGDEQVS